MYFDKSRIFTPLSFPFFVPFSIGYFSDTLKDLENQVKEDKEQFRQLYNEDSLYSLKSFKGYNYFYFLNVREDYQRPFNDVDELIKIYCHRFGIKQENYILPSIWVKNKSDGTRSQILEFLDGVVVLFGKAMTLSQLKENYTFLDNSPCSVITIEEPRIK